MNLVVLNSFGRKFEDGYRHSFVEFVFELDISFTMSPTEMI